MPVSLIFSFGWLSQLAYVALVITIIVRFLSYRIVTCNLPQTNQSNIQHCDHSDYTAARQDIETDEAKIG